MAQGDSSDVVGAAQSAADPIGGQIYFVRRESAELVRVPNRSVP